MGDLRRWQGRWVLRAGARSFVDVGPASMHAHEAAEVAARFVSAGLVSTSRPDRAAICSPGCDCVGCEFRAAREVRRAG